MRGDRSFEQQFQWEVDRWVFRYRHKGDPIEVTREERDRLVERHEARMLFGSRMLKLGIVAIFLFCLAFPRHAEWIVIPVYASVFISVPLFTHWAYSDVTAHLRERTPIGMRLGIVGRMTRHAQAQSWRRLLWGFAYLLVISGLMYAAIDKSAFSLGYLVLDSAIGLFLIWMIVVKWAEQTRERARNRKMDDIRRARGLRP